MQAKRNDLSQPCKQKKEKENLMLALPIGARWPYPAQEHANIHIIDVVPPILSFLQSYYIS